MRRTASVLGSLVLWVLVALSVAITMGSLMGRPVLLAAVPSGSMLPALQPGDLIVVVPLGLAGQPRPGDIVVFRSRRDSVWVVHRIIGGDPEAGFVTRGDANPAPDPDPARVADMAGIVPVWRERALRIPHLGFFSLEHGPLSSPLAAGAAMLLGIYLLGADAGATLRALRTGRLRRPRLRFRHMSPETVLAIYGGLAGAVFLTTLLATWGLGSVERASYEVVAQSPAGARLAGRVLAGQPHREEVPIHNPSLLPLLITFHSTDPHLRYEPSSLVLLPRRQGTVTVVVQSWQPGRHEVTLRQGVYLLWVPPFLLRAMDRSSPAAARVMSAMAPALLVLALAAADPRARRALRRIYLWGRTLFFDAD